MKGVLLCVLAFALPASGQTTYQPPPQESPAIPTAQSKLPNTLIGVVIESWRFDPEQKTLTLHLANHSQKDVTAFQHFLCGEVRRWQHKSVVRGGHTAQSAGQPKNGRHARFVDRRTT